jgi:amino acid adenylation domain-containing protein
MVAELRTPQLNPRPDYRAETMHGLFRWCVDRWPSAVALRHHDREVTYSELDAMSESYALQLEALGVRRGHFVPVLMPRTPEFIAVLLAVLKRGAAYAALDVRWPQARLTEMMTMLKASLVVTDVHGPWPLPVWRPAVRKYQGSPTPVRVSGDDPSSIFFTSGSSGKPKAVVCAHRGTVRLFDDWDFAPVGSSVVMPQSLAASWDAFGLDSWGVLLGGGTLILLDDGTLELARRLRALVRDSGVTTVFVPTAVFQMIVETDLDAFAGLRVVGTGGERLSPRHAALFLARYPEIPLHNMYGPVESTIAATSHIVRPQDCDSPQGIPLGLPLPGTEAYVLDGTRLCDVGETGEICLSGAGLAIGYWQDPVLTSEKFVSMAIDGVPKRLYRTGDLGSWSAEGLLCFQGRRDRQVKVRGHRVEPDEIERAAQAVDGVGSAVVVPVGGADGNWEELCLFYVSIGSLPEDDLREQLALSLPSHLVPGHVYRIDRLPVLEDRKVNRHELISIFAEHCASEKAADQPRTGTERLIAGIFTEILGAADVSRSVSMFTMGGNSLAVARMCVRIDEVFGVSLPVGQVFDAATVAGIARLVGDAERGSDD